jgi:hypothetical protein
MMRKINMNKTILESMMIISCDEEETQSKPHNMLAQALTCFLRERVRVRTAAVAVRLKTRLTMNLKKV